MVSKANKTNGVSCKTEYTYNTEGWVTKVKVPYFNGTYMTTDYTYDMLVNKLTEADGLGNKRLSGNSVESYGSPYKMTIGEFVVFKNSPEDSALVFHGHYERSSDDEKTKKNRNRYAKKWSEHFEK